MSKEIKIGLIGAGWMGKAHTTAFHNARMIFGDDMPVFELVSDVSEDAVAKFAKNMGYNHQLDGRCYRSRNRSGGRCNPELHALRDGKGCSRARQACLLREAAVSVC
jgi:hypothetical protein